MKLSVDELLNITIAKAIQIALQEFGMTPAEINTGYCDIFAQRVIEIMGGYSNFLEDDATPDDNLPSHYWVVYKGKCYDSECVGGVKDWHDLPIFKKHAARCGT